MASLRSEGFRLGVMPVAPVVDPAQLAFRADEVTAAYDRSAEARQQRALRSLQIQLAKAQADEAEAPGLAQLNLEQLLAGEEPITREAYKSVVNPQPQKRGLFRRTAAPSAPDERAKQVITERHQRQQQAARNQETYDREAGYYDELNTRYRNSQEVADRVRNAALEYVDEQGNTRSTAVDSLLRNEFQKLQNLGISSVQPSPSTVNRVGQAGGSLEEFWEGLQQMLKRGGSLLPTERLAIIGLVQDFHRQNAEEYAREISNRQAAFGDLVRVSPREEFLLAHAHNTLEDPGIFRSVEHSPAGVLADARIQSLGAELQQIIAEKLQEHPHLTVEDVLSALEEPALLSEIPIAPAAAPAPALRVPVSRTPPQTMGPDYQPAAPAPASEADIPTPQTIQELDALTAELRLRQGHPTPTSWGTLLRKDPQLDWRTTQSLPMLRRNLALQEEVVRRLEASERPDVYTRVQLQEAKTIIAELTRRIEEGTARMEAIQRALAE